MTNPHRSSGMASVEIGGGGGGQRRSSATNTTATSPSSTRGSSSLGYSMRTGHYSTKVSPFSSSTGGESEYVTGRGRIQSSLSSFIGGKGGDWEVKDGGMELNRKEKRPIWSRALHIFEFQDVRIENEFRLIQKRTASATFRRVLAPLASIEVTMIFFDLVSPPPGEKSEQVFIFRLCLALLCLFTKIGLAAFGTSRALKTFTSLYKKAVALVLLQSITLVLTQYRRALKLFGDYSSLCKLETQSDSVPQDFKCSWVNSDSLLLMCLVVFLSSISYSIGIVSITTLSACIVVVVYLIPSIALQVPVHVLDVAMLCLFGGICIWGSVLSEVRQRGLFERTLLTREALRRNRKLRASFDRHVDNERNLLEQAQLLHEENEILRKKANILDESMSNVELESPLLASIHDLRDIQRKARRDNNVVLADTLEKVIRKLQSKSLNDIDIAIGAKQSSNLDANTKEWLSEATSGWEQRRLKNRKRRTSSGHQNINRESVAISPTAADGKLLKQVDFPTKSHTDLARALREGKKHESLVARGQMGATLLTVSEMKTHISKIASWNEFDLFAFVNTTEFPVCALVDAIIGQQKTLSLLNVSYSRLMNFLQHVDRTYCYGQTYDQSEESRSKLRNPYHNNVHAADVIQSVYCFLNSCDIFKEMSPTDLFACTIAAAIHDYHHPGRTNQFLVTQGHPIAIQHNDQSPNERFHLSEAFRIMQEDKRNFLCRLSRKQRLEIRQTIIDLVLATDLSQTMKYLSSFQMFLSRQQERESATMNLNVLETVAEEPLQRRNSNESLSSGGSSSILENEESILLLQIAIKVADIGHAAKPLSKHLIWSERIQQEFFIQGDEQKAGGYNVDPLCDRETVNMNKAQMGFIDFVCRPLIEPFSDFINMPCLMENLVQNYKHWSEKDASKNSSSNSLP